MELQQNPVTTAATCLVEVLSTLGILGCALGEDANAHLKGSHMSALGTAVAASCAALLRQ